MTAPVLLSTEFPFEFLHSEIVTFMCERDATKPRNELNAVTKLERMGYRVGYALAERLSKEVPRLTTELEVMKFMCKDFWTSVFRKQVDNLKTNHQGVYVVNDNQFWLLSSFSCTDQYKDDAPKQLAFSCGLIRGALSNLGLVSVVTAEVAQMPLVKFNVNIQPKL